MNSETIARILRSKPLTAKHFKGVYPIDALPPLTDFQCYIIVNTSDSHVPRGHWVLLYFKDDKNVTFFDSFGRPPSDVNNGRMLYSLLKSIILNITNIYCKVNGVVYVVIIVFM